MACDIISKTPLLQESLPSVYSDVSAQRDWIDRTIENNGGATYCPVSSTVTTPSPKPTSELNVQESINAVKAQAAKVKLLNNDNLDEKTKRMLTELVTELDDLVKKLEDYYREISSRPRVRRQDDTCSSLSQLLMKLASIKSKTKMIISKINSILELTNLPQNARIQIEPFKIWHEEHLDDIVKEEEAYGCGSISPPTSRPTTKLTTKSTSRLSRLRAASLVNQGHV